MNPAIAMWLNFAMAALGGVATVAPSAVGAQGSVVVQGAAAAVSILGILNGFLHGFSTPAAGPLATPPAA